MTQPRACTPSPVLRATALAALMATAGLASKLAHAQEAPSTLNRVEVTGSAIKRLESETALPVQVITRADIVKAGITTAAELVASLSAASNSLTDGVSIGTGGFKDQMGFNSANLRGLGTSSTLVLLNGRRMANFASPGDDSGVDLNTIPMAAIQRVEVLLDGASALYGTDAIGGVVNFITRKDYQGVQLDAYAGASKEGGAGKRSASLAGGTGDVVRDGFNLFGVLDLQRTDALSTSQRQFITDLKIPERLPHLLSSAGFRPISASVAINGTTCRTKASRSMARPSAAEPSISAHRPASRRTPCTCPRASAAWMAAPTISCGTSSSTPRPTRPASWGVACSSSTAAPRCLWKRR